MIAVSIILPTEFLFKYMSVKVPCRMIAMMGSAPAHHFWRPKWVGLATPGKWATAPQTHPFLQNHKCPEKCPDCVYSNGRGSSNRPSPAPRVRPLSAACGLHRVHVYPCVAVAKFARPRAMVYQLGSLHLGCTHNMAECRQRTIAPPHALLRAAWKERSSVLWQQPQPQPARR